MPKIPYMKSISLARQLPIPTLIPFPAPSLSPDLAKMEKLNRQMVFSQQGPQPSLIPQRIGNYIDDVVSGRIAMQGINRIAGTGDRMAKGDAQAALDMTMEFGGLGAITKFIKPILGFKKEGVKLYTGVTPGGKRITTGKIEGPAYFTGRKDVAEQYADEVVEVFIPENKLKIDFDLPGGRLLDIDDANKYIDAKGLTASDFIEQGYSVGVNESVLIRNIRN